MTYFFFLLPFFFFLHMYACLCMGGWECVRVVHVHMCARGGQRLMLEILHRCFSTLSSEALSETQSPRIKVSLFTSLLVPAFLGWVLRIPKLLTLGVANSLITEPSPQLLLVFFRFPHPVSGILQDV